ncbi:MAG: sensor histidine kinase [Saprospiraceae bacterium]|jgi:hypothetical protein|nr:sensor histidine kinase [Saprospiraceae bacterium]
MKIILQKIEHFILTHTVWIFFAAIFFMSDFMLKKGWEPSWGNYLMNAVKLSVFFSPIILYSFFRNHIQTRLSKYISRGLWAFCFVIYPFLFLELNGHNWLDRSSLGEVIIMATWFALIAIECLILAHELNKSQQVGHFFKDVTLEQGIWISMALFAIVYLLIGYVSNEDMDLDFWKSFQYTAGILIILIIYYFFYLINHYFLITKLWKEKGLIYYVFGFLATIIFLYPIATQLIYFIPMVKETQIHPVNNGRIFDDINWLVPFFGMLMSIPFILMVRWFRQTKELTELEKEKSATELSLLKQQINPHFFFNTLNNLYALSLIKDKQTPEVILQLSELMRYVIYRGKEAFVFLHEEVKYIEDYLELQKIRLHKKLDFKFEKDILNEKLEIPPLLFITLIENAFKHGIEPSENECFLHISLFTTENELTFTCENSFEEKLEGESGIGLSNLRRRLELRFPDQHEFKVEENGQKFKSTLKIQLNV